MNSDNQLKLPKTNRWEGSIPLPPNEDSLPVIKAHRWLQVRDPGRWTNIEGLGFDLQNSLYFVIPCEGQIRKVTFPDRTMATIYDDKGASQPSCVKFHKDGRIFTADIKNSKVYAINPDGTGKTDIVTGINCADDIIFDKQGNFYITELDGDCRNRKSRIFRVSSDFKKVDVVISGYGGANGIALAPDDKYLYTTDFTGNELIRSQFMPDGVTLAKINGCEVIYRFTGSCGPDSTYVDADGNIYQPIWSQGRVLVLDERGIPLANVLLEDRNKFLDCTSVSIKPGTREGYIVAAGTGGSAIFSFIALGKAITMFSHR